jgi:hypothetical protein
MAKSPLDSELVNSLLGKIVLAGLTYVDAAGNVTEQKQLHGKIVAIIKSEIKLEHPKTGEAFSLPPDFSSFKKAAPGEYTLGESGEVVKDPDLLCTWTVQATEEDDCSDN